MSREKKLALPKPTSKKEQFYHALNVLLADAIHSKLSIKALRIIMGVHYLQRRREEIFVGEIHAIYYEITRDPSWSYESCRAMCNVMSKNGWLIKHMIDGHVAYTIPDRTKDLLGL